MTTPITKNLRNGNIPIGLNLSLRIIPTIDFVEFERVFAKLNSKSANSDLYYLVLIVLKTTTL